MIWRSAAGENAARSRWRTFVEWQIRKTCESAADLIHNVDTFGPAADGIGDNMWPYRYDATPWSALRRIFRYLNIDFPRSTFIDVGCGKGRIVLAASAYPFESVIGVEFSAPLCRIAEKNLATGRFLQRRAGSTQIVECDATEFLIPVRPCVFFFYNPFSFELLETVFEKIITSYRESPRDLYLICVGMSAVLPEMARIQALRLLSFSNIPWPIWTSRSVNVFLVTGNRLGQPC